VLPDVENIVGWFVNKLEEGQAKATNPVSTILLTAIKWILDFIIMS
jgi:hypothetical protein